MSNQFRNLLLCFAGLAVVACGEIKTPDSVAGLFWQAVKSGDRNQVAEFSTEASEPKVDISAHRWRNIDVSYGMTIVKNSNAEVETKLNFLEQGASGIMEFNTVLKKEQGHWKVDYAATMAAVSRQNPLGRILRKLETMGLEYAKRLNDALTEIEREIPDIQKDVEEKSNRFLEDLERSIERQLPEIEKGIEKFKESIDQALKEAQKKRPKEAEKDALDDRVKSI